MNHDEYAELQRAIAKAWKAVKPAGLDRDDAEGELALHAVKIESLYDPQRGPREAFLVAAFKNRLTDMSRKKDALSEAYTLTIDKESEADDIGESDNRADVAHLLNSRIADVQTRDIFRASQLEGFSAADIAEQFKISRRTVDRIIKDAWKQLRPE